MLVSISGKHFKGWIIAIEKQNHFRSKASWLPIIQAKYSKFVCKYSVLRMRVQWLMRMRVEWLIYIILKLCKTNLKFCATATLKFIYIYINKNATAVRMSSNLKKLLQAKTKYWTFRLWSTIKQVYSFTNMSNPINSNGTTNVLEVKHVHKYSHQGLTLYSTTSLVTLDWCHVKSILL